MSVQKKSLIGDRTAVKKAIIASKPDTTSIGQPKPLQAEALVSVHSLKGKAFKAPKMKAFKAPKMKAFKAPKMKAFKSI
jgi:hypothetical protein